MKRRKRVAKIRPKLLTQPIKIASDLQLDWSQHIPTLKKIQIKSVDFLAISGDAPKDFTRDREYRAGHRSRRRPTDSYIAKVGSKFYPLESLIEQLITRIGQIFGLKIAKSKLRIIDGQVRFLSRYFLRGGEQLIHGAEIYEYSLGKDNYKELSDKKAEAEYFTFQMTCETIRELFPNEAQHIINGYVEMLAFDAIIGHNDRHPYNWGVIVPVRKATRARFSPVFDTARALYWNIPESGIVLMLSDVQAFNAYVRKCKAPVGWDGWKNVDFFNLIALIYNEFPDCRKHIERYLQSERLSEACEMIDGEFVGLLSDNRRELMKTCLHHRQSQLIETINSWK